jgi:hypothetical protein
VLSKLVVAIISLEVSAVCILRALFPEQCRALKMDAEDSWNILVITYMTVRYSPEHHNMKNVNTSFHNNNSVQLFIYVPSQQLQGQLQTQHNAVISNYTMDKFNIKSRVNYRNTLMQKKQTKQNEDDR